MSLQAENDARMQSLYRQKDELFGRLFSMAEGAAAIVHGELAGVLRELKAVDDELNALTEEMVYTILTDLRP